jgi:hypothetical protein
MQDKAPFPSWLPVAKTESPFDEPLRVSFSGARTIAWVLRMAKHPFPAEFGGALSSIEEEVQT